MGERRDDLADAAIGVLSREGLRGLTHRAVDAAAGLAEGTSSYYFRTRAALLQACVDRLTAITVARVAPVPDTGPDTTRTTPSDPATGEDGARSGGEAGPEEAQPDDAARPAGEARPDDAARSDDAARPERARPEKARPERARPDGVPGTGGADPTTAMVDRACDLLERWLGPDRDLLIARYELSLESTRRPELEAALVAGGARVRSAAAAGMRAAGLDHPEQRANDLVACLDGLAFDQVAGAGRNARDADARRRAVAAVVTAFTA